MLPRISDEDFVSFLRQNRVGDKVMQLFKENQIDGISFCLLTEQDLRELSTLTIGERKQLLLLIAHWRRIIERLSISHTNPILNLLNDPRKITPLQRNGLSYFFNGTYSSDCEHNFFKGCGDGRAFMDILDTSDSETTENDCFEPRPQLFKLIISAFYVFLVAGLTSFVMVVAHERLPDISKYPPLPDLFLDNLPYISWAFRAAEWVGVVLMFIWFLILLFHRHRLILIRRFFALLGTVFLLRSFTMIITSLSVPGVHLTKQCTPYVFENNTDRLKRVLEVWFGMGMSIRGIQTCGDYMFSGHTTVLTLLNFFITEYSPRCFNMLHTFSWVLNLFGVFFILASHEHYSIDVFVAIYVSSRLFLYYHCLANNRILHQEDKDRAMIWFPLFTFFEYDVNGIVPNEYEIPFLCCVTSNGTNATCASSINRKNQKTASQTPKTMTQSNPADASSGSPVSHDKHL